MREFKVSSQPTTIASQILSETRLVLLLPICYSKLFCPSRGCHYCVPIKHRIISLKGLDMPLESVFAATTLIESLSLYTCKCCLASIKACSGKQRSPAGQQTMAVSTNLHANSIDCACSSNILAFTEDRTFP